MALFYGDVDHVKAHERCTWVMARERRCPHMSNEQCAACHQAVCGQHIRPHYRKHHRELV